MGEPCCAARDVTGRLVQGNCFAQSTRCRSRGLDAASATSGASSARPELGAVVNVMFTVVEARGIDTATGAGDDDEIPVFRVCWKRGRVTNASGYQPLSGSSVPFAEGFLIPECVVPRGDMPPVPKAYTKSLILQLVRRARGEPEAVFASASVCPPPMRLNISRHPSVCSALRPPALSLNSAPFPCRGASRGPGCCAA